MSNQVKVSVIIPVYNDVVNLKKCMVALGNQTASSDSFEIIVVDNESSVDLSKILGNDFPDVIFIKEKKVGSYAARNTGIKISKGDLLFFTDSDCIPDKNWIEKGAKCISDNNNAVIGGRINLIQPNHLGIVQKYSSIFNLDQNFHVTNENFAVTANLFANKKVFKDVGLFNDNLKSGGDAEWCHRAVVKGYEIMFDENSVVNHKTIGSFGDLIKKQKRYMGGRYDRAVLSGNVLKWFLKSMAASLTLGIRSGLRIIKTSRFSISDKIILLFLNIVIKFVDMVEVVRLVTGGKSKRS